MTTIVVCPNGEEVLAFKKFYGPFEGRNHAELWVKAVHKADDDPCIYAVEVHPVLELEKPAGPR